MNRENLIKKLTDRKMAAPQKSKAICICMARVALCFAALRTAAEK